MTDTRQTTTQAAVDGHRRKVRHWDPVTLARTTERSGKMITQEIAHRDFGELEDLFASLADGGREPSLLLVDRNVRAALAREQEDAAMEAQDILSQADEALVMG